jgi:hypothetical protein
LGGRSICLTPSSLVARLPPTDAEVTCLTVTQLLERAFAAASKLPELEQDAVAALLLAELEAERRWTETFAASQEQLSALADEALREFEAGDTRAMDLERDFPNH